MKKIIIFDINLIFKNHTNYFKNKLKTNNLIIDDLFYSPNYYNLCRGRLSFKNYNKIIENKYPKIYSKFLLNNYFYINNDIFEYINFLNKQNIPINLCGDIPEHSYINYNQYCNFDELFISQILSFNIGYIKQQDEEFTEILINNFETSPKNLILITNKIKYNYLPQKYGINILNYSNT